MDIKSKNIKVVGVIISVLLITAFAVGIVMFYSPVYNNMILKQEKNQAKILEQEEQYNQYLKEDFVRVLYKSNFVLLLNVVQLNTKSNLTAYELFFPERSGWTTKEEFINDSFDKEEGVTPKETPSTNVEFNQDSSENMDVWIDGEVLFQVPGIIDGEAVLEYDVTNWDSYFNQMMKEWEETFYSNTVNGYPSFYYYASYGTTEKSLTNSVDSLESLIEDTKESQELKEAYPFYLILTTDANGKLFVSDSKGLEKTQMDLLLSMHLLNDVVQEASYSYPMEGYGNYIQTHPYQNLIKLPPNSTIIYASKAADFYDSGTYFYHNEMDSTWNFIENGFGYVCIAAFFGILLFAFVLPFVKTIGIGRGFSTRIPFEVSVVAVGITMGLYEQLAYQALCSVRSDFIFDPDVAILSKIPQKVIAFGCNVVVWMVVLSIWYLGALSLRQVFTLGLVRFLKEKTFTGRFFGWCKRKFKLFLESIKEVDLREKSTKNIIKILAINYIILALICCVWIFGIVLLIPYTMVLFFLLRKYLIDIKLKYQTLLEATSKIADGNLEVVIDEKLGVFEPIKEELARIQQGFSKAVIEETKSERMKTELITNVSHDLKTPLTAIITYVDLLKGENVTEEERKSYIETLDLKSQRLKRLIEDLFEVSKAASNNITLNMMEVDLANLIKQVLLELDDKMKLAYIDVRHNLSDQRVILNLDSEKTYRIFENLFINITKYAMPHTRAYIDLMVNEDTVSVAVKNVSAMELNFSPEEITERFVRGDLSRNTEGSGLGLAITKSFVELQGGKFTIVADGDLFKAVMEWRIK